MDINLLIEQLYSLKGPDRPTDEALGVFLGWRREQVDSSGGKIIWLPPKENGGTNLPHYTRDLNAAFNFAQQLCPQNVGACSWEPGMGSAKIDGGNVAQAASAPIALCVAALLERRDRLDS